MRLTDINTSETSNSSDSGDSSADRLTTPSHTLNLEAQAVQDALYSTYHSFRVLQPDGRALFAHLTDLLPHIHPDSWSQRAAFGGLHINGRCVTADITNTEPWFIEYYDPKYAVEDAPTFFPSISQDNILFTDDYLVIAFKPAGIPTITSREQSHFSLRNSLVKLFGCPFHLPSRLDASTAGVVATSKHPDTHNKLQQLYSQRQVDKRYRCTVERAPSWKSAIIDLPIGRTATHTVLREPNGTDALDAQTSCTVLDSSSERTVIEAKPITGRTHQIRVHIGSMAGPIDGDRFYGGRATTDGLHLLSHSIQFSHPLTGKEIECTVPERFMPEWASE